MKKILLFLFTILSLKGFSQDLTVNAERPLGVIFSSNNFTSLAPFTVLSGTWTVSGGKLLNSAGVGDYTSQVIGIKQPSMLNDWQGCVVYHCTAVNGTSYGLAIGKSSTAVFSKLSAFGIVNSSGTGITYLIGSSFQTLRQTTATHTISTNDKIRVILRRQGQVFTIYSKNLTTNDAEDTAKYIYNGNPTTGAPMDNMGLFALSNVGGAMSVDSLAFSSEVPMNATLAIPDDSKGQWYGCDAQGYGFIDLLNKDMASVVNLSGSSDGLQDVSSEVPEVISLHPKNVLLMAGSNDPRNGVSSGVYLARYDSIATAYQNAGINVYFAVMWESSVSQAPYVTHILATYPLSKYIDVYDAMQAAGATCLAPDGVHPNNLGDSIAYNTIKQAFSIIPVQRRFSLDPAAAYNLSGPWTWSVPTASTANGYIPINIKGYTGNNNTFQLGTSGFQVTGIDQFIFSSNGYYNGTNQIYNGNGAFEMLQFFGGDVIIKNGVSGTAGNPVTLRTWFAVKNSGTVLVGTSTDPGFGNFDVLGTQGIVSYYDASHLFAFGADVSGNGIISSTTHKYGLGMALSGLSVTPGEINIGTGLSQSDWGLGGIKLVSLPNTFINTSTAGSGTVTAAAFNTFYADTANTTNSNITYTDLYEVRIAKPGIPVNNTQNVAATHKQSLLLEGGLTIADGTQSNGYVLTCDAAGRGTWQAGGGGATTLYTGNGTLGANRTVSAGGFNLSLGATGDKLSQLTVNSSAGISLQGQIQYGIYQPGDANIVVPNNVSIVELPIISANRTITMPTMAVGAVIHFFNTNTSNVNQWSITGVTVVDANGFNNISTLRSGRSYDVIYDGSIYILKDNGMGIPTQTLFTGTATTTVASSNTPTSIVGAGVGTMTIPANFLYPGKTLRIKIAGVYGLLATTPGNLTINLKIGSTTIATGTITNFIGTAPTNQGFDIEATVTCRVAGSSGTVMTDGIMTYENNATAFSPRSDIDLNNAGATTTVNTTTSNLIDCIAQWQTNSSSNTISATIVSVEIVN